jgi:hypothetical protein
VKIDMSTKTIKLIEEWLTLRELSLAEAQARFSISDDQLQFYLGYGELEDLTGFGNLANYPGFFYFSDGNFVLFYIDKMDSDIETLSLKEVLDYFGEPEAIWPSNIGKRQQQYVYAKKGVSFSATEDEITFIEFFKPISLDTYKAQFYEEPSPSMR